MYQPDHFRVEDVVQMHALMRARPFAALVSRGSLGLYASHLPTVLKDEAPRTPASPLFIGFYFQLVPCFMESLWSHYLPQCREVIDSPDPPLEGPLLTFW
jgi:Putative FMN-binding domain